MTNKNKIKVSLLLLMLLWLPGCNNKTNEHQEYKSVYSLSDYDAETLDKIDKAYVRGSERYHAAQKKLQDKDSMQRAQQIRNSAIKNTNAR